MFSHTRLSFRGVTHEDVHSCFAIGPCKIFVSTLNRWSVVSHSRRCTCVCVSSWFETEAEAAPAGLDRRPSAMPRPGAARLSLTAAKASSPLSRSCLEKEREGGRRRSSTPRVDSRSPAAVLEAVLPVVFEGTSRSHPTCVAPPPCIGHIRNSVGGMTNTKKNESGCVGWHGEIKITKTIKRKQTQM